MDIPQPFPAAFAAADIPSAEAPQALDLLHGTWRGDGLSMTIDTNRSQALRDPKRPFDWQPFVIRNVTGNVVVFRIGAVDFFAVVAPEQISVTSWEFQGNRTLSRVQ